MFGSAACLDGGELLLGLVRDEAEDGVREPQVPDCALGRGRPRRVERHECLGRIGRQPLQVVEPVRDADGRGVSRRLRRSDRGAEEVPGRPCRSCARHEVCVGVQVDVVVAIGDRLQQRPHPLRTQN